VAGMSPKQWGLFGCLLACLLFNPAGGDEEIDKEIKIFEEMYTDGTHRARLANLAGVIVKDQKFQEEFKEFLAKVGKPEFELNFMPQEEGNGTESRFGRPNGAPKSPATKKRIKTLKKMFNEPKFQEVAKKFAMFVLHDLKFQRLVRDILPDMKLKIEDRRPKSSTSKPKLLAEDTMEYSEESSQPSNR